MHEVCAAEGGGPPLDPFSSHLWISYGGMDYLSTLATLAHMESERSGYLSLMYQLINRLGRVRTIQISLHVIPDWSSYKLRKSLILKFKGFSANCNGRNVSYEKATSGVGFFQSWAWF